MIDPRPSVFARRLNPIRRVVAVGGGKGGVGKTTITTLTALATASAGHSVGLLDLDIHGGATQLFLGIEPAFPEEEGGILPYHGPLGVTQVLASVPIDPALESAIGKPEALLKTASAVALAGVADTLVSE